MKKIVNWDKIQRLIEAGTPYKVVSDQFGVKNDLIRKRASLERWNTPNRVQERIEELKIQQLKIDNKINGNDENLEIISQSRQEVNGENLDLIAKTWLDRAEDHRLTAYKIARKGLLQAEKKEIPVLDWSDIEKIDKLGRRSVGLDGNEGNLSVNIGLQLVNSRIEQDDLPLDAMEISK